MREADELRQTGRMGGDKEAQQTIRVEHLSKERSHLVLLLSRHLLRAQYLVSVTIERANLRAVSRVSEKSNSSLCRCTCCPLLVLYLYYLLLKI